MNWYCSEETQMGNVDLKIEFNQNEKTIVKYAYMYPFIHVISYIYFRRGGLKHYVVRKFAKVIIVVALWTKP